MGVIVTGIYTHRFLMSNTVAGQNTMGINLKTMKASIFGDDYLLDPAALSEKNAAATPEKRKKILLDLQHELSEELGI